MVDEVEVMKNYLKVIQEPTVDTMPEIIAGAGESKDDGSEGKIDAPVGATIEMKVKTLDNLETIIENLDMAVNLHIIGGYPILIDILSTEYVASSDTFMYSLCLLCDDILIKNLMYSSTSMLCIHLYSEDSKIKIGALRVLSTCVQNNPKAQLGAYEAGIMPILMNGLSTEEPNLQLKYITCISCVARGFDPVSSVLNVVYVCTPM